MRRWGGWILLVVVVIGALVVGTRPSGTNTNAERVQSIAKSVRCPTCRGQSVADSDAPAAANVRKDIERRVADGQSDDDIRSALAARFGDGILLTPPRSGVAGLVWVLPVVAVAAAAGGLTLAFRRWRREW
ncbi:MAG: cytochrome c-type biosis protein CcmH [Actinomycetota bacterium]